MLDKQGNEIDAVIVAIPDHMHAFGALAFKDEEEFATGTRCFVKLLGEILTQEACYYEETAFGISEHFL